MDGKVNHGGSYPDLHHGPQGYSPQHGYGQPGQYPGYAPPPPQMSSQQQSTTVVIQQQPQVQQNPLRLVDIHGSRPWSTGLFECFADISNCLYTMCCYPCAVCSLASRTGECVCTPLCIPGTELILRARIRTIGGITGNICNDCLTLACCPMCATCQEARELTAMGF